VAAVDPMAIKRVLLSYFVTSNKVLKLGRYNGIRKNIARNKLEELPRSLIDMGLIGLGSFSGEINCLNAQRSVDLHEKLANLIKFIPN